MPKLKDAICCWGDLLVGQACCIWNCLFAPFILTYWACVVYIGGCFNVYLNRGFYKFCCCCCRICGCCWTYTDSEFPPNDTSLGDIGGDSANVESGKNAIPHVWLRADEFDVDKQGKKMELFGPTVDSRDVCQGALGDCWLLAAMACAAEHEGLIQSLFKTRERNPRGKYALRLYDGVDEKWKKIVIDDYIPCNKVAYEKGGKHTPLFTQPNGNEMWAMLLEKAFAKLGGSFAGIEGGQTIWAIRAMTGDPARWFFKEDGAWKRFDLKNLPDEQNSKNRMKNTLKLNGEKIDSDIMFEILLKYHGLGSILCASGGSGQKGLHQGHAYSILEVQKVNDGMMGIGGTDHKMIKIRNPWGGGEWNGDWGDDSKKWDDHPRVKSALNYEKVDDGSFWMCWADYLQHWERIGVVDRTIDINSLRLHPKNNSFCAPTTACIGGCCKFWCCCRGCSRLYCAHHSSDETIKVGGCCGMCQKGARVEPA